MDEVVICVPAEKDIRAAQNKVGDTSEVRFELLRNFME